MTFSTNNIEVNNNLVINAGSYSYYINGQTLSSDVTLFLPTASINDTFILSNKPQIVYNKILLSTDGNIIDSTKLNGFTLSSVTPSIGDALIYNGNYWTPTSGSVTTVVTTTASAIIAVGTSINVNYSITALSSALTIQTSGTAIDFDKLIVRIKDIGVAQSLTFDPINFEAKGMALPTTTVANKLLTAGFIYDSITGKFGCVSVAQEI